jgi:hypothetical protein
VASIVRRSLSNGSTAYLVRFRTADGQQRSKQFARRRDAEGYASLIEADRTQGTFIDRRLRRITLDDWSARCWPTVTDVRPSTRIRDEGYYRTHVRPVLGSTPPSRLDRTVLRQLVADLIDPEGSALAPATVYKVIQVLNKAVRAALEDRLIAINPVDRLPLSKVQREEMRFLSHEELAVLAGAIDPRYRAFVLLGGYGGSPPRRDAGAALEAGRPAPPQGRRRGDPHRSPRPRQLQAAED